MTRVSNEASRDSLAAPPRRVAASRLRVLALLALGVSVSLLDPPGASASLRPNLPSVSWVGADQHVHIFAWRDGWTHLDLTLLANGQPVEVGSPIASTKVSDEGLRVVYSGTDEHLHELTQLGGVWVDRDLTSLTRVKPSRKTALATITELGGAIQLVYMRGENGHLYELEGNTAGTLWSALDISAASQTIGASFDVKLSAVLSGGVPRLFYTGDQNHLHQLSRDAEDHDTWFDEDITIAGSGIEAFPGSTFAAINAQAPLAPRLFYIGSDSDVHNQYFVFQHWFDVNLTHVVDGPVFDGGVVSATSGGAQGLPFVFMTGAEGGRVREMFISPETGRWTSRSINVSPGSPAIAPGAGLTSLGVNVDGRPQAYFVDPDGHVWEVAPDSAWGQLDLSAVTRTSVKAAGPLAITGISG